MPNTKLTAEKLKVHFHYSKMLYLVVVLVAAMIGSLVFTMTAYQPPNERKIDIELIGNYADTSMAGVKDVQNALLQAGQAFELERDGDLGLTDDPKYEIPLQEVTFLSLQYDPESSSEDTYYASQKYMVTLAAQEGDIYVLTRLLMTDLADQGLLVPLDDYIAGGVIDPGDRELGKVTFDELDENGTATGEQKVYALQADTLTGLYDTLGYDPTGKFLCIVAFSRNQDTAAVVLQEMIDIFEPDEEPGSASGDPEGGAQ